MPPGSDPPPVNTAAFGNTLGSGTPTIWPPVLVKHCEVVLAIAPVPLTSPTWASVKVSVPPLTGKPEGVCKLPEMVPA